MLSTESNYFVACIIDPFLDGHCLGNNESSETDGFTVAMFKIP